MLVEVFVPDRVEARLGQLELLISCCGAFSGL